MYSHCSGVRSTEIVREKKIKASRKREGRDKNKEKRTQKNREQEDDGKYRRIGKETELR